MARGGLHPCQSEHGYREVQSILRVLTIFQILDLSESKYRSSALAGGYPATKDSLVECCSDSVDGGTPPLMEAVRTTL
jgi:hypothetical protein